MPESVIFKLRETQLNVAPSNQFETIIYMIFNFGFYEIDSNRNRIYIPLTYPTGLKIKPCFWNPKPTYRAKQTRNIEYHSINARLDHLEFLAKKAYRDMINKDLPPSPLSIKNAIDDMDNSKIIVTEKILQYTTRYIREMEDGKRLYNSRRFAIGTIKNYKGLLAQLQEYQRKKARQINWEDITSEFYFDFIRYFSAKNYSPNTIGRHIKCLKTVLAAALNEGIHEFKDFRNKAFKVLKERVENVYLGEKELKTLFELDLSNQPKLDLTRDVFLVGCYTAQRFSDYSTIQCFNKKQLNNGSLIIDIIQKKTGERVIIPIRPELNSIMEKYKWNLPITYEQKVNERIKEVARIAGLTESITIERTKGGISRKEQIPKCELIKTHTARRSGCTNMYLAGIPTIDIMKISGHRSE